MPDKFDAHCPNCETVIAVLRPAGFPAGAKFTNMTLRAWCPVCMKPVLITVI